MVQLKCNRIAHIILKLNTTTKPSVQANENETFFYENETNKSKDLGFGILI